MRFIRNVAFCAVAAMFGLSFGASAAVISFDDICNTGPKLGRGECFVSAEGLDRTEAIFKIEFGSSDQVEYNEKFGPEDVDLSNLDFKIDASGVTREGGSGNGLGGTLKYSIEDGAPGATAFMLKAANDIILVYDERISFDAELGVFSFDLDGLVKCNECLSGAAISNLVVFDNFDLPEIPLPASAWLMIGALGGIASLKRRRKAA